MIQASFDFAAQFNIIAASILEKPLAFHGRKFQYDGE
jgi:hypothetical protein